MKRFPLLAVSAAALLAGGCLMIDPRALFAGAELTEVVLEQDEGWFVSDKILLVDVSGVIADQDGGGLLGGDFTCSPHYLRTVLRRAEQDPAIRAVVLRIDSPGGTVTASEVLAREVKSFRARTGLPVYAHIQSLGCSGGYYVAAACDEIHIQPAGLTGSIGVIAVLPAYARLADKIGYEERVIKSGALKDLGSGMRDLTPEERAIFQALIDESYGQFLDWVLAGRPQVGDREQLKKLADGRIYTASQAKANRLVDEVCHLDESVAAVKEAAGVERAQVVSYSYALSADANLYSPSAVSPTPRLLNLNVPAPLRPHAPGLYYLWRPGG